MIDDRTSVLNLPLPNQANNLVDDVSRLRTSLSVLDGAVLTPGVVHAATSKTTPVDADELPLIDSVSTFSLKRLTWANLKAAAKTYFDTLYASISHVGAGGAAHSNVVASGAAGFMSGADKTKLDGLSTTSLTTVQYDDRDDIRSLNPSNGDLIIVSGLGLFSFITGSTEIVDDETCFSTSSGRWLLEAVSFELVNALINGIDEDQPPVVTVTGQAEYISSSFYMNLTSMASLASSYFTVTVNGALVGDNVLVTTGDNFGTTLANMSKLSYCAYVISANTVNVSIRNASASTAAMQASTWKILIIRP